MFSSFRSSLIILFLISFVLVLVIAKGGFYVSNTSNTKECLIETKEKIVHGSSLVPLIKPGQKIKVLLDYYNCHKIQRGDVVLYSYAGDEVPLIKIVKGIPGDSFKLGKTSSNGWHILINGHVLKNSEGIPYLISGKRYEMLALYQKNYKGKIPEEAYLLLGNLPSGSTDSTHFGLVGKQDILGKAERYSQ